AVPVRLLVILMLAFGASLALKAFEERQSADTATLRQQAREAETLAGHVRAELVAARARMEGLLINDASLGAIRQGVPFDGVSMREPPPGVWAQLADKEGVRVYAQTPRGDWIAGVRAEAALMLEPAGGREFYLAPLSAVSRQARFEMTNFDRSAIACAPVSDAGIAACVVRQAPLLDFGDLNRLVIYGLLLAAPLLAVFGLVGRIRRLERERAKAEAAKPTPAAAEAAMWSAFEISGLLGLWRWDPASRLLTIGREAAALVGAPAHGEVTLGAFTAMRSEEHT